MGSSFRQTVHSAIQGTPTAGHVVVAREPLASMIRRLEVARASAVVCDLALKGQNAERDSEIATVMRWWVVDLLSRQIEILDQMADTGSRTHPKRPIGRRKAGVAKPAKPRVLRITGSVLDEIRHHLSLAASAASACCTALETQNIETDVDIATTLKHSLVDVLRQEVERIGLANRTNEQ